MTNGGTNRTSRHIAVLCLIRWDKDRQAVHAHVENMIHNSNLNTSDRHLAVTMVIGVLRQLQYLDSIIARFAKHPLKKMKPLTLMTLRVGVYQLLFLDRIPDSAAVNETVKVLKEERQPKWLRSFVNGVLRNITRQKTDLPVVDKAGDSGTPVLNHPAWIVKRWQERFGFGKTEEICRINNLEPSLVLRVNTLLTSREELAKQFRTAGVEVHKGKYAPDALVVEASAGSVIGMPGYTEGFFHVQDEAAQLVTMLLGPFKEEGRYLDACAGLGGKTCQLAQLFHGVNAITAIEPNEHRFQLLQENLKRLSLDNKVQCYKSRVGELVQNGLGNFHGVLVDAPCSGTGVIRRHPEIRWNRSLEDLQSYQQDQLEILQQAGQYLQPDGVLVYVTCSMEPEENEQVVDKFLSNNPDYLLTDAGSFLPGSAKLLVNPAGFFSTTPVDGLDGFFGARLVRT